jgi:hypothetical protein
MPGQGPSGGGGGGYTPGEPYQYGTPTGYGPADAGSQSAPPGGEPGPPDGPAGSDAPTGYGPAPERKSRRGLWAVLIALSAVIVLAVAAVLVFTTLKSSGSPSFAVGTCVKRDGANATAANCSDTNAYKVVEKVDNKDRCPDANQPYVEIRHPGGKDEFLCLRPASTK